MKQKSNSNKTILVIGAVVAIVLVIVCVLMFTNKKNDNPKNGNNGESLETILTNLGKEFYETKYYPTLQDKQVLANYVNSGLNIRLTNLDVILPINDEIRSKLDENNCNYDNTRIMIYPEEPFEAKNYTLKVELACQK